MSLRDSSVGVRVVISSLILSAALVYHARASAPIAPPTIGRYQIHVTSPSERIWVIDTKTGVVTDRPY
jgi:hypothetical protein